MGLAVLSLSSAHSEGWIGERKGANHLLSSHDDSLDAEFTTAHVEEVLERRSEQVDDEDVVKAFVSKVVDLGDAGCNTRRARCTLEKEAGGAAERRWSERGSLAQEASRGEDERQPERIL